MEVDKVIADPKGGSLMMEEDIKPEISPSKASDTIFCNNLNEKVKIRVLKQTLTNLFKNYGKVLSVTAHSNLRMRGQAFVAMDSTEAAEKAINEVKGFPLYGKPLQLDFAKTPSDSVVMKKRPAEYDQHKAERVQRKKISRADNPVRRKLLARKVAAQGGDAAAATGTQRRIVQMPSEYLPPHKVLFVQNLPDEADKAALEALFRPYPNFVEVRMVPGRKGIAFVEYEDDTSSAAARDKVHNVKFGGDESDGPKVKVTFARA